MLQQHKPQRARVIALAQEWNKERPRPIKALPTTHAARLIAMVACWYGVTPKAITGPSKDTRLVKAPFDAIAAVFINCRLTGRRLRLNEIGRHFGGRHHATIWYALIMRDLKVSRSGRTKRRSRN
jgi:chromosomal replication initiation ATPase DnaA